MNTRFPYGDPLPRRRNPERVANVIASQRSSVSDMYLGAITQRDILTVDVPVPIEGGKRYVLAQAFFPEHFNELFRGRNLPSEWLVAINDKEGRTIARTYRAQEFVGKPISPALLEAS